MELTFSEARGPIFHYSEPTQTYFGEQASERDPIAKKYLYLKDSNISDSAGESSSINLPCFEFTSMFSK